MPAAIRAYSVLHHNLRKNRKIVTELKDLDLVDNGHTIIVKIIDADDRSYDELYIDGHCIHPDNWHYESRSNRNNRGSLQFLQHPSKQQRISLGGNLVFDEDYKSGLGVMYFADTRTGVIFEEIPVDKSKVIVGTYELAKRQKKVAALTIHPKGMVINGMKCKNFKLSGNKATWRGITGGGIFREGFIEFSDNGDKIIRSSVDGTGRICPLLRQQSARGTSDPLTVQDLLKQYPFNDEGIDEVQQTAMDDFYLLVQYFMPEQWLHDFISPERPQLEAYLRNVAEDDSNNGENEAYYVSLAVPYLTYVLSTAEKADHPDITHLNYIRSDSRMKTTMQNSPVYERHAAKMYSHNWGEKFPRMQEYLDDQNSDQYDAEIASMCAEWRSEVKLDIEDALSAENLDSIVTDINDIAQYAIDNNQYWAFKIYRELSSTEYLNKIRMEILFSPKMIDEIMRDHERYCSIMSILDPSSYFSYEYTAALKIFQLSEVIPENFDPTSADYDLNVFAKRILDAFVEFYSDSKDPQLKEMAAKIKEMMADHSWQNLLEYFKAAATISTNWNTFYSNLKMKLTMAFGKGGAALATMMSLGCFGYGIFMLASGMVGWNDLTAVEQAEFIKACVETTAFLLKKGYPILLKLTNGWWEPIKSLFYKTKGALANATAKISGAIGRFIVKYGWANKMAQGLKQIEKVLGKAFNKVFSKLSNFGSKFITKKKLSMGFSGIMAIAGVVFSAIGLSNSSTPMEAAMNSMFLLSGVANIVAAAASWVLEGATLSSTITLIGGSTVGVNTVATIASIAGGIAVAAAIVGFIVMMVMIFSNKDPPDPVKDFVYSSDVSSAGFYMAYNTTIEYFAVQMDEEDETEEVGITMTTDGSTYLYVNADGSITFGNIEHSYNTVFTVTSNEKGYSQILTKQVDADNVDLVYYLTINKDNSVNMSELSDDEEAVKRQEWVIECMEEGVYNDKDQLKSAGFYIYNDVQDLYLRKDGDKITSGADPQKWTIKLEYMQPGEMEMRPVVMNNRQFNRKFYPYLGQPGSTSGRSFSISPALPSDWLEFDTKTGVVSQVEGVKPPITPAKDYTITAKNSHGPGVSCQFTIEVQEYVDPSSK